MFIKIGQQAESVLVTSIVSTAVEETPPGDINASNYPWRVVVKLSDGRTIAHTWCADQSSAWSAREDLDKIVSDLLKN